MTKPTTASYNEVLLKIGDGQSPETIAQSCLINGDKALELSAQFSDDMIPDCSDGTLPAKILRQAESVSFTGSGAGKVHITDAKAYADLLAAGQPINAVLEVGGSGVSGAFKITCQIVLTRFRVTTSRPSTAECEIEFSSHGFEADDIAANA